MWSLHLPNDIEPSRRPSGGDLCDHFTGDVRFCFRSQKLLGNNAEMIAHPGQGDGIEEPVAVAQPRNSPKRAYLSYRGWLGITLGSAGTSFLSSSLALPRRNGGAPTFG